MLTQVDTNDRFSTRYLCGEVPRVWKTIETDPRLNSCRNGNTSIKYSILLPSSTEHFPRDNNNNRNNEEGNT